LSGRWTEHAVAADEAGRTVLEILTGPMGISRRMVQRLTRARALRHNRRPAWLAARVRRGDTVEARLPVGGSDAIRPVRMSLAVLIEDADLLVVDKPPFVLVHPTAPEHDRTLVHGVAAHLLSRGEAPSVHPVHRIDRDTSGAVLLAKSPHVHHRLDLQLRSGEVEREYLALVAGVPEGEAGVIDAPVGRDPRQPALRTVRDDGEPAVTRWRLEARLEGASLLRCVLETGRTHQIRVHLRHAGHPLLGDRAYGGPAVAGLRRQALHGARLAFRHPRTGDPVVAEAPLPEDLAAVLARLGPP
jgi:23S rRNA pseudouridine1911/1915/1917 synthase